MKLKAVYAVSIALAALSVSACAPAATPTPALSSNPPIVSSIPRPSEAQTASLLTELGKINPALNHERSVDRARNTCSEILRGEVESLIFENARKRFEGGSTGPLTAEQAQQIVSVVKANGFCVKS